MNKKLYCIGLASYACPPPPWRLRIYINMAISSGRLVVNTTHTTHSRSSQRFTITVVTPSYLVFQFITFV